MRVGMMPFLTGDEWEAKGNYHLVKLFESLTRLGWEVVALEADDFMAPGRLTEKNIKLIFIHWPSSILDVGDLSRAEGVGRITDFLKAKGLRNPGSLTQKMVSSFAIICSVLLDPVHGSLVRSTAARRIKQITQSIKECGLPLVWEMHDLGSHHLSGQGPLARIEESFNRSLYDLCSAIVLHESSCLAPVHDAFGSTRPHITAQLGPYSYGPPIETKEARRRLGISSCGKIIAHIGTARSNRNPAEAASSFSRVAGKHDSLIIAGMGVGAYLPEELIDSRMIIFDGFQSPEKMRDIFCAADFVINDAQRYLTSAVVRAAMTYGVPVIARPFGSTLDMAKGAAIFIERDGLDEALREALRLENKRYESLRCEAIKRDAERRWERSGERISELFRNLIDRSDLSIKQIIGDASVENQ